MCDFINNNFNAVDWNSLISAVIGGVITGGFSLWAVVFKAIPEANNDAAKMILGSLATMAAGVVYYWTGSTNSKGAADETIAAQGVMLANAPPPTTPP